MEETQLTEHLVELIRRSSTCLPLDVREALKAGMEDEANRSTARSVLRKILDNARLAEKKSTPICQDTGTLSFNVAYGPGYRQAFLRAVIEAATRQATDRCYLRPNAVHPVSGHNSGDNIGRGAPTIHFSESDELGLAIQLMQKGGGCENTSAQYSLPHADLGAKRNLEGVRRVVLDAIHQAQGLGCAPGILGVCIGGDRASSYAEAKSQIFRRLDDTNPDSVLDALERQILREGNQLGIGPMGFGGATTLLGVKIGIRHRLPASYFVSIAYMCWASRRASLTIDSEGNVTYA